MQRAKALEAAAEVAAGRHARSLVSLCFSSWRSYVASRHRLCAHTYVAEVMGERAQLKRAWASLLAGVRKSKHDTMMRPAVLKCIHTWRLRLHERKMLDQKAVVAHNHWRRRMLSSCFVAWSSTVTAVRREAQLEAAAMQHRCCALKAAAFVRWRRQHADAKRMRVISLRISDRSSNRLLSAAMRAWVDWCAVKAVSRHARQHAARQTLKNVVAAWHGAARESALRRRRLHEVVVVLSNRRTTTALFAWRAWAGRHRRSRATLSCADLHFSNTARRHAVDSWRRWASARRHEEAATMVAYGHWSQRVLKAGVAVWRGWCRGSRPVQAAARRVKAAVEARTLRDVMRAWRRLQQKMAADRVIEEQRVALTRAALNTGILRRVFASWLRVHRASMQRAIVVARAWSMGRQRIMRAAWLGWLAHTATRRVKQSRYAAAHRFNAIRLVWHAWRGWRGVLTYNRHLVDAASVIGSTCEHSLVRRSFYAWRQYVRRRKRLASAFLHGLAWRRLNDAAGAWDDAAPGAHGHQLPLEGGDDGYQHAAATGKYQDVGVPRSASPPGDEPAAATVPSASTAFHQHPHGHHADTLDPYAAALAAIEKAAQARAAVDTVSMLAATGTPGAATKVGGAAVEPSGVDWPGEQFDTGGGVADDAVSVATTTTMVSRRTAARPQPKPLLQHALLPAGHGSSPAARFPTPGYDPTAAGHQPYHHHPAGGDIDATAHLASHLQFLASSLLHRIAVLESLVAGGIGYARGSDGLDGDDDGADDDENEDGSGRGSDNTENDGDAPTTLSADVALPLSLTIASLKVQLAQVMAAGDMPRDHLAS